MSIENPHFHTVQFVTDIMASYHSCLRGEVATRKDAPDVRDLVIEFASAIEEKIDASMRTPKAEEKSGGGSHYD